MKRALLLIVRKLIPAGIVAAACGASLISNASAEVLERVVAIVNEDIILLSELNSRMQSSAESDRELTEEEILRGMINNRLLLQEAKKYQFRPAVSRQGREVDEEALIREYIDRKIKIFVPVTPLEIEKYFRENRSSFQDKELYEVREEIEEHLVKKETTLKLREHIAELRKRAYIRVQLEDEG